MHPEARPCGAEASSHALQGWDDVGGMDEVRAALQESLELPTRFARLVAKAPLRLRTGDRPVQTPNPGPDCVTSLKPYIP